jgi:transposase-like protein
VPETEDDLQGREHWAEAYRRGDSMPKIAADNGVVPSTVYLALKRMGVPARDNRKSPLYREMYEQGYSISQIGRHFGVSRQAVQQSLARLDARMKDNAEG